MVVEWKKIKQALQSWIKCRDKLFRYSPLIIAWGVWITRNKSIFQDSSSTPMIVVAHVIGILSHFSQSKEIWDPCLDHPLYMDQGNPWVFFDGLAGGDQNRGGCGVVLHLFDSNYFHRKFGMDHPTNNLVELMGLKILLLASIEKKFGFLHVFRDSMLAINLENGTQQCHIMKCIPIIEVIIHLLHYFDFVTTAHVYRDRNQVEN